MRRLYLRSAFRYVGARTLEVDTDHKLVNPGAVPAGGRRCKLPDARRAWYNSVHCVISIVNMTLRRLLATSAAIALVSTSLCSSASANNRITALPESREIKHAVLGFYGLNVDTYAPVTEADILKNGCVYATEPGSDKNSELMRILQDGVKLSDQGKMRFRLRTVIYLFLKDDSVLRLAISDAHNRTPGVFGTIDNEIQDSEGFLLSNEATLHALRSWAREGLRARNPDAAC